MAELPGGTMSTTDHQPTAHAAPPLETCRECRQAWPCDTAATSFFRSSPTQRALGAVYRRCEFAVRFTAGLAVAWFVLPRLLPHPASLVTWLALGFLAGSCGAASVVALHMTRRLVPAWARWHHVAVTAHRHRRVAA
ncbi:hypothetical protein Afil01_30900 [Actinorhabdospora filicis]|uniref:Uncharacterized protein n=1 Tax=Actinorhabdospora filicis TaxID=1785913 RepID=A0A9W6SLN9_9ACTN|nr:hypothetical protein Afil01_30900 [Actinorhabdospora filicis]